MNHDIPFQWLRWFFDHAETVSTRSLERIKALGGGIADQHRMAYQGEYFVNRYWAKAAEHLNNMRPSWPTLTMRCQAAGEEAW